MKKFIIYILVISALYLAGCGDELSLDEFPITNNGNVNVSDTVYILQSPVWTGFNGPEDVHLGYEPMVYVADTKNNRIVQMDIAGGFIGQLEINNPRKISQDYNFDLLVIGDSVLATSDTISILYRINTVVTGGNISNASKITLLKSTYPTPNSSNLRKFTGVSTFADNSYIVTRTGPDDPFGIDPGNALLKVIGRNSVTSVTLLSGFQTTGNSFYSIEFVSGVTSVSNTNTDFIITRSTPDTTTLNKVLWFMYNSTNGTYDPKYTTPSLNIVNTKFGEPTDVALDLNQNIFVIDSYRNFMFKFNNAGRMLPESFGNPEGSLSVFNNPKGISYFNKIIYIADTDNNRIVRYKLSTELN
ncbi:MAG: hypothetical protein MUE56_04585 [Ignavibacteria bacterium]|jgi:hypothetical protein|nr:hypothetical protein [Ignavibacteria bacterium]